MSRPTVILLPGLHGTANLCQRFVDAAPHDASPRVQPLPNDAPLDYEQLAEWVVARLPSEPVVLIAESFSGPLALFAAARAPNVVGIVLCGTFVTAPAPPILARLPKVVFAITPPVAAISALLTAGDWTLAREVQTTVRTIPADVITSRLVSALHVDARAELERFTKPLLCISAKRDWIVSARSTAMIRALKPSAEFVEIDGPHMLLQTRSRQTWQVVSAFLDRVQGNNPAPHNVTSSI